MCDNLVNSAPIISDSMESFNYVDKFYIDRRFEGSKQGNQKACFRSNLNDTFENLRLSETSASYNTLRMFQMLEDPDNFNSPLGILPILTGT